MSRPPQLQWEPQRSKWKVVYHGKKYRFDGGSGKSDRVAKQRAEKAWKAKKAEIDHTAELAKPYRLEYEKVISEWNEVLSWSVDHGEEAAAAAARAKIRDLENRLGEPSPSPLAWADRFFAGPPPLYEENERMKEVYREAGLDQPMKMSDPVPFEHTLWKDRLDAQARRLDHVGDDDTFAANVEMFLQTKRNEVAAGQLSAARADLLRIYLDVVMDYVGKKSSVAQIDAALLANFRNHLLERIASKEISAYYGRDVFAAFKLFIRWVANNTDKLDALPRNIDDKRLNIAISRQKAKTLSTEAIKQLLKQATGRTRLYLLLGLNCAMTQQDMSDLHPSEVDWTAGIIRRKRSKTGDYENVPEVAYKLWPSTLVLLRQERSTSEKHVLLNRCGSLVALTEIDRRGRHADL